MTETPLVQTKLRPPRLASTLIERPRLAARLAAHPGRVVLVSAPAGFGKTATMVEWATAAGPTAWLSLDRFDNDLGRFRAHLAAAIAGLDGPHAEAAAAFIGALDPLPHPELPPELVEALAALGPEPVVVLDDLHEIDSPEVMRVVEALVNGPREGPRLALLTREDPPFPTARLRVSGTLLELRASDLRFTTEETGRFFELVLPGVLEPALVRRLDRRTEGWPAGLRLAAIALHEAEDPAALAESFAGTHRLVTEYLLEEALGRQSPEIQQFLMETSVLGRFNGESCSAITGDEASAVLLAEVQQAGLFLVPLGRDGQWYRYHRLFAELLEFRMETRQPARLEEIHRRASEWFEREGDLAAALEHAAAMRDQTRLLRLLDAQVLGMLARGEMGALRYWIDQVRDDSAAGYPMVLCLQGWLRVVTDRAPDLDSILHAIRTALDRAPDDYEPDRRQQAELHMDVLTAYAARYGRRYEEALRSDEVVRPRLAPHDPMTRGLLTYNTARVRMALADMAEAADMLERAFDDHLRSGNQYLTLASLGRMAAVLAQTRGVPAARDSIEAAFAFAEERRLEKHPAMSIVLYNRGFIELLADRLEEAERWFRAAVELTPPQDYPEERVNALVGLARVAAARGAFEEADAQLLEATAVGQARNADLGDSTLPLERARVAIARQAAAAGQAVPGIQPEEEVEGWTAIRETQLILAIRQEVVAGASAVAKRMAEELERESRARERGPALCYALLARAVVDPTVADHAVDEALELAAAREYVRPVLDGGSPVLGLLREVESGLSSPAARRHARRILGRASAGGPPVGQPTQPGTDPAVLGELLTDREADVLACLFEGQSNKAIARTLFVSVDTVKTHLKHIYGKLDVTSRSRAVARARELGFDPHGNQEPPEPGGAP